MTTGVIGFSVGRPRLLHAPGASGPLLAILRLDPPRALLTPLLLVLPSQTEAVVSTRCPRKRSTMYQTPVVE